MSDEEQQTPQNEEEILTQEEVDALTSDDEGADQVEEVALDSGGQVRSYDFMKPAHTRRGHFPTLEIINERTAKSLQEQLGEMLQDKLEVIPVDVEFVKYGEFIASLPMPVDIKKIHISRLNGHMLVCFGLELLNTVIEKYFGSPSLTGEQTNGNAKHEFTAVEQKISMKLLNRVMKGLTEGWSYIENFEFKHVQSESMPKMLGILDASELMLRMDFRIELNEHQVNIITAIPYKCLEKVKSKLRTTVRNINDGKDKIWINKIFGKLHKIPVEVVGQLGTTTLSVKQLIDLDDGDVLSIAKPEYVTVSSNGVPLFTGQLGESKGQTAIKVMSKINLDD